VLTLVLEPVRRAGLWASLPALLFHSRWFSTPRRCYIRADRTCAWQLSCYQRWLKLPVWSTF